jgi:hypothetical protein
MARDSTAFSPIRDGIVVESRTKEISKKILPQKKAARPAATERN